MNEITIRDTLYLPEFEECLRRNGYSFNVEPIYFSDSEEVGAEISIYKRNKYVRLLSELQKKLRSTYE